MEPADVKAIDERSRYELYARLRALKAHWPRRFERRLGQAGEAMLAALEPYVLDRGRYLKLRRIALAHLAAGDVGDASAILDVNR